MIHDHPHLHCHLCDHRLRRRTMAEAPRGLCYHNLILIILIIVIITIVVIGDNHSHHDHDDHINDQARAKLVTARAKLQEDIRLKVS